jgi:hypothetical protein
MQLRDRTFIFLSLLLSVAPAGAQNSNELLQQSLKDTNVQPSWIYNDLNAGFAEAKKTGKPLLVVFR